ncbi:alanyl-tRNA synthetase, putative [Eimeria maxima]|uniref:Alanine--tRNA ligase n=1 Tax=Eimeria maxima TaxID=5804 RepID=U6M2U7_EIMMA|nr:alanyl-tRNA synthetase, putative [Eimeria maxima]CDJ57403.1 alanyl-tRNA synthetase, putative [Eimeria maxima]
MAAPQSNLSNGVLQMEQLQEMVERARQNGWPSADVRELYIAFFEHVKHKRYPSSPVVPHGDNTLLFINAGMNQFKPIFLGQVDKNSPLGRLRRVVDTQKCIRAGGKHNDLEDVGKDEYHHTFFEMLGNWSFGDYFKEEAIDWAWQLLTEVYKLPKDRLYATYFGGDSKFPNCPPDLEAKQFWLKYLPEDRVLPFGAKENFWEMADVGPCGPCTEIHFDRIGGRNAASLVNMDDPSVLEIWNLVFMQFNRENAQTLTPLPAPCVDTGMGLERLVSVLQNKKSNYDTDLFQPIFERIHSFNTKLPKYQGKVGEEDKNKIDTAYRVLADHIRCLTVAITDGAEPSNEGRGYVLRRILRRAVRFSKQTLQLPDGSFPKLASCVCSSLGSVFPELLRSQERVQSVLLKEEQQFTKTLDKAAVNTVARYFVCYGRLLAKGVDRFKKVVASLAPRGMFPGSEAFTLYTTYGFPLDLTQLMAEEEGREVDVEEFNKKFEEHRAASENVSFKASGGESVCRLPPDQHHKLEQQGLPPTDDSYKYHWNIAQRPYNPESETTPPCTCKLQAIWNGTNFIDTVSEDGTVIALVLDKTPFYAEQGGQLGDEGFLEINGHHFRVRDTQKSGSYVLHVGTLFGGASLKVGDLLTPRVNYARRLGLAQHHTGTHLLAAGLRHVLLDRDNSKKETGKGTEDNDTETERRTIKQKGSLVEERRLRFDFDWDAPLTNQQIEAIELYVQRAIASSLPVNTAVLPLKTAMELPALCAVFGEVYPDPVRVVSIGPDTKELKTIQETQGADKINASVELCGGTHLSNASQLEDFVVISEESIAKGIRRIVAVAGEAAVSARSELRDVCGTIIWVLAYGVYAQLSLANLESASPTFPFFEKEVQQAKSFVESNKTIPLLSRRRLLAELEHKQKLGLELSKFRAKELLRVGKVLGQEAASAAKGKKFVVLNLTQLQGDGKALDEAAKALQAAAPSLPFLVLTGLESRGTSCISFSPKGSPLESSKWLNEALKELGGKGGGKERSVGAAKDGTVNGLKRAITAAVAFAEAALQ